MSHKSFAALLLISLLAAGCGLRLAAPPATAPGAAPTAPPAAPAWIDTHTHPSTNIVAIDKAGGSRADFAYCVTPQCLESMQAILDAVGANYALLMPAPAMASRGGAQYEAELASAARASPEHFFYVGGGATLNPLIHQAVAAGNVTAAARTEFEHAAQAILADGAVGFGEIAILHLSASPNHAFEEAPADHELFLLLADLAAQYDVPLDIHMDPVLVNSPTPADFLKRSSQNPATLQGNITPFETLLAHNPAAHIIWAHTANTTGDLSAELVRSLLENHPNLYLSLRLASSQESLLDRAGHIQTDWLSLIQDYPDRFVIGSDTFWGEEQATPGQTLAAAFLGQLPEAVARAVACQNAATLYHLEIICP
jgi:hypothetical protein